MCLLKENDSILIVIDIQDKLVKATEGYEAANRASILVKASKILGIPVIVSEQYPKGLGNTVSEISNNLTEGTYIQEKTSFSLLQEDGFREKLKSYNKKQVVICGIETHICVYQTVAELIAEGYEVVVAKDACSSRKIFECEQGLDVMKTCGAKISCVEMILFEWLRTSKHAKFKEVQVLIK